MRGSSWIWQRRSRSLRSKTRCVLGMHMSQLRAFEVGVILLLARSCRFHGTTLRPLNVHIQRVSSSQNQFREIPI